jgi:cell division protein FtsB
MPKKEIAVDVQVGRCKMHLATRRPFLASAHEVLLSVTVTNEAGDLFALNLDRAAAQKVLGVLTEFVDEEADR